MSRPLLLPDHFTLALVSTVILASVLPCQGQLAGVFNGLTNVAIGLLFFLHGAKLSREAIVAGMTHWRLHGVVLLSTFAAFPLFGIVFKPLLMPLVTPALYTGILFLCTLPSTVQSSIAFTSIAKGNVSAAVCSASASSLIGIFLTPALVGLVMPHQAAVSGMGWHTVGDLMLQLFVPFMAGQLLRPIIGKWMMRHHYVLRFVDQGSILLVVYTAFSAAVNEGLWRQIPFSALAGLVLANGVILAAALITTIWVSKRLGFNWADRITIIFCGSKKSLSAGVPMAKIIFAAHAVGLVVLPVMVFHQMQLMVCAALAQRWRARSTSSEAPHGAP